MSTEVPLKIRVDIRDLWDAKDSSVQDAIASLTKTLGHKVVPNVEWPALWGELKDRYPDKSTFVPTILRLTVSWYDILTGRLENDVYAEWTEKLLEVTSGASHGNKLTLQIEPSSAKASQPNTEWKSDFGTFYLGIPNADLASSAAVHSALEKDFDNLFGASESTERKEDDGWADVLEEAKSPARSAAVPATYRSIALEPPATERLPTLDALARPTELFASSSPYVLIVQHMGNKLWIQSSHEKSLKLLASYFKKWARTNPNDSARYPVLKVELNNSDFVSGMIDGVTIEPTMSHLAKNVVLNPTIVLGFIEGVLGYRVVHTDGSRWVYKSDTLLK